MQFNSVQSSGPNWTPEYGGFGGEGSGTCSPPKGGSPHDWGETGLTFGEPQKSSEEPEVKPLQPRRSTLAERASRASHDKSFNLGLSLETLQACSRDAEDVAGLGSSEAQKAEGKASFRGWHITEEGRYIPTTCKGSMRVMSYNILAARYVTTDRYPFCPTYALMEAYRAKQILREVEGCDPDVIGYQEISIDMFEGNTLLGGLLRERGYAGHHVVITGKQGEVCHLGGASGQEVRGEFEGVALFYKTSRYQCLEVIPLRFNSIAQRDKSLLPAERFRVQIPSHNVALVLVLQDKESNNVTIVGTLHASWDTVQKPECQQYQVHHLAAQIEDLKGMYENIGDTSVVLCGDFNAELNSYALTYALKNSLQEATATATDDAGCSDFVGAGGQHLHVPLHHSCTSSADAETSTPLCTTSPGLSAAHGGGGTPSVFTQPMMTPPSAFADWCAHPRTHSLTLRDAYASYCARYTAKVSAVNPSTNGEGKVIDHILYDKTAMVCVAVAKLGERAEIPSRNIPSDHYPIAATLVPLHSVAFVAEPAVLSDDEQ